MAIPIYTIEAFTIGDNQPWTGNPAAVCILEFDDDIPDNVKQSIAQTMNLSETAFVAKDWKRSEPVLLKGGQCDDPKNPRWTLRWFTPTNEVPLCGHATVGSAKAILTHDKEGGSIEKIVFESKFRGTLTASNDKAKKLIVLDFPSNPTTKVPLQSSWLPNMAKALLGPAFGDDDATVINQLEDVQFCDKESVIVLRLKKKPDEEGIDSIRKVAPNFEQLFEAPTGELNVMCQIVTIEGDKSTSAGATKPNFYSRFFARKNGVDEDPVTGLGHTILTPYWTKEFGLQNMLAHQASKRGGDVTCSLNGDRVTLGAKARVTVQGFLSL